MLKRYVDMLGDPRRVEAFRSAITAVAPGKVVADVGCGLGTYAFAARRAGAGAVYAVESSKEVLQAAETISRTSGTDGITFLHGDSRFLEVPERADVVIFEDVRLLVMDADIAETLRDVRRRWLKSDGRVVPERVEIFLAPFAADSPFVREREAVAVAAAGGLDLSTLIDRTRHEIHPVAGKPEWLLAAPAPVATLLLGREERFDVLGEATITIREPGLCRGLLGWFRLHLGGDVVYDTGPAAGPNAWGGQAFLPASEPWPVAPGDVLSVHLTGFDRPSGYYWRWRLSVNGRAQEMTTWSTAPPPTIAADLDRWATRATAVRSMLELLLKGSARNCRPLPQILLERWPGQFPSEAAAARFLERIERLLQHD